MVCNAGIAPSEYWRMSPHEVGLILDYNQPVERYGSADVDEVEEMLDMRKQDAPIVNGKQTRWI